MQHAQSDIKNHYQDSGFCFPLDGISSEEAAKFREKFEQVEPRIDASGARRGGQLNQAHAILTFVDDLVRNDAILDQVEAVLGPNIMVWGSTFFIKEPRSTGFVSWHQDLRYWGLKNPDDMVSAWVALGPVTKENGCMQFVAGSHKLGLVEHNDNKDDDNFLYRGQQANVKIDENKVYHVELEAGQFSMHHGHLLHASPANHSDIRRWGLTINYITPENQQIVSPRDFAMLVRGEDKFNHFETVNAPETDLSDSALSHHRDIIAAKDGATFDGAATAP